MARAKSKLKKIGSRIAGKSALKKKKTKKTVKKKTKAKSKPPLKKKKIKIVKKSKMKEEAEKRMSMVGKLVNHQILKNLGMKYRIFKAFIQ